MSTCLLINADHWIFEFSVTKTPLADLTQLTFCYFLGSFIMKLAGFTINLQIVGYPLLVTVSLLPYLSGHHEIFKSFLYILGKWINCGLQHSNTLTDPKIFYWTNIFFDTKYFLEWKNIFCEKIIWSEIIQEVYDYSIFAVWLVAVMQ